MKPVITDSAKDIICNELKLPFVHSIILIGSRARGDGNAKSDYDLYVVTPIGVLPFVFPVLKKKEKILREKLKADVSLSPLTYSRMKRGKDTLLFHTKKEGVILCGKDVKSKIRIDSISELPSDELFQYFFDALFYLISPLKDPFLRNYDKNDLIRASAKTILYCANLRLMLNGIYSGSWGNVAKLSNEELVVTAYKVIGGRFKVKDPIDFWLLAGAYSIETLKILVNWRYNREIQNIEEFYGLYLSNTDKKRDILRKIQQLLLSIIYGLDVRPILKKSSLDRELHIILLWLVVLICQSSSNKKISDRIKSLNQAMNQLGMAKSTTPIQLWYLGKDLITKYWKIVCGKSIL